MGSFGTTEWGAVLRTLEDSAVTSVGRGNEAVAASAAATLDHVGALRAWRFMRSSAPALREGLILVLGVVLGIVVSRCISFLSSRRRRSTPITRQLPLRRFTWDDFCLVLVHLQHDRYSRNAPVREAFPSLGAHVSELVGLCRGQGVEVVHLRDGSCPRTSPWYRFWLRMNPGGNANADPSVPEEFAAELAGEQVFVGSGYDGVGVDCGLEPYLRSRGRSVVLICGLTTSCSVHADALGLFLRGYETFVVADCCGDRTAKLHAGTLRRESRRSYAVCSLEGVRELLSSGPRFDLLADFRRCPANVTQFEMRL